MSKIVIVFHSGYGHTAKVAQAVAEGAGGTLLAIDAEGNLPEGGWDQLAAAKTIVFGSPTYMGSVSWQFKKFADASSKPWYTQTWKDKIFAGFTVSANVNGDKFSTLHYFMTLAMQHGAEPGSNVVKDVLEKLHAKGQGTGPKDEVGQVLYMRGMIASMLAVEGVKRAQERFGKGKVMTGEQARWGYENLALDQKKLDALGFAGVMRPISTSCADHRGATWARVHTWDGAKWNFSSDWYQSDDSIIKPMIKAAADKYAAEKKLTRRTPEDCQS